MQTLVDAYCDAFTDHSACCNSSRSIKLKYLKVECVVLQR